MDTSPYMTNCFPTGVDRGGYARYGSRQQTLDRMNAQVDAIAERHGYALPPATSDHPSAQEVRDRIEVLRRTIPDLSNNENAKLSRMDLRLHEMTNPERLAGKLGVGTFRGGIGASWDGEGTITTADRLGELLREQNGGVSGAFAQTFSDGPGRHAP